MTIFSDGLFYPFQFLNSNIGVYPNQFKVWELQYVPKNFWNQDTGIQTTKWLIEEKLRWSDDDIREKMNTKIFDKYRLDWMFELLYNNSSWKAHQCGLSQSFQGVGNENHSE